jgi:hypothetical protein
MFVRKNRKLLATTFLQMLVFSDIAKAVVDAPNGAWALPGATLTDTIANGTWRANSVGGMSATVINAPGDNYSIVATSNINANRANAIWDYASQQIIGGANAIISVNENLTVGSIAPAFGTLSFSLAANKQLYFNGFGSNDTVKYGFALPTNLYQGLTNITLNTGSFFQVTPNGGGTITLSTPITTSVNNQGNFSINGKVTVAGTIGLGNALSNVSFDGSGNIALQSTSNATTFTVTNAGANVTANGLMTGALNYTAAGTVNANSGIAGNIDFKNTAGIFNLGANQTITGTVNNTIGGSNGTLNFLGAGTVGGAIGGTNPLLAVNFNGAGNVNLNSTSKATTFTVANPVANVTSAGIITGSLNYTAPGTVNAKGGLTGNTDFKNNAGIFNLGANQTITGTVNNTIGGSNGTLNFLGAGTVGGAIGGTNPLLAVNFNGAGNVNFNSTSRATTFTVANAGANVTASNLMTGALNYTAGGTVTVNNGITGNVSFAAGSNGSVFKLAANKIVTGNVDNTSGSSGVGTLEFLGVPTAGSITGSIGASKILAAVKYSGAGTFNIPASHNNASTLTINNTGVIGIAGILIPTNVNWTANGGAIISNAGQNGNVDFAGKAGIYNLATGQTVTGNIDSTVTTGGTFIFSGSGTVTGSIGATNPLAVVSFNGPGNVNLNSTSRATTFTASNAGTNVTANALMTGALNYTNVGTVTVNNGITGNVSFAAGSNGSVFKLGANKIVTGNVDNTSGSSGVGTLEFLGTPTAGSITGSIGASKILAAIKYSGAGTFNIPASHNNASTLTINNTGVIGTAGSLIATNINWTANGGVINVNAGQTGNVDFAGKAGIYNLAFGQTVTGNIDSTVATGGTLIFLGNNTVTGSIGATNPLTAINFNGAGNVNLNSTSRATTFTVANAGANVTATGLMTGL